MTTRILHFITILTAIVLFSCDSNEEPAPPAPAGECRRTVIVYQVANRNGLSIKSTDDLAEMRTAAAEGQFGKDGRLLVYNHRNTLPPMLLEILPDRVDTLKTYPSGLSSVDASHMAEVFGDMATLRPAREYGLVLWGHGSGWLQDGVTDNPVRRSYGGDNGQWMNISTLAEVLRQAPKFEFLYFDCCYMASAETAYEIGTAVPQIAASVIEIAGEGMPYHRTLKYLFSDDPDALVQAAEASVEYYREWQRIGSRPECSPANFAGRYCAMSVIDTEGISAVADAARTIFSRTPALYSSDMHLTAYGRGTHSLHYFDFGSYMGALCLDSAGTERYAGASADLAAFEAALDACVTYKADMGFVFGSSTAIPSHSGLSTYVIRTPENISDENHYDTLEWYRDVVSAHNKPIK